MFDSKLPLHGLPEGSLPDGITIDCDGHLWIALFFGGRVVQVISLLLTINYNLIILILVNIDMETFLNF